MRRLAILAALTFSFVGCRSEDVDVRTQVVVPAGVTSVGPGILRMSLWAYDPRLADAPATAVDASSLPFTHVQGRRDEVTMRVHGTVPTGARYYVTIWGYDVAGGVERYILWDGLEALGTPGVVVMQAVH